MTKAPTRLSLGRTMVWFVASYGVATLGYLGVSAIAGRLLGPETFGYFVIIVTVTTLIGQLGLFGVHRSGLREAARLAPEQTDELANLRRGVRAVNFLALPVIAVGTGLVTILLLSGHPPLHRWLIGIATAAMVFLSGQQKLWSNYLRGFGAVRFANLLEGRSGGALVALLQAGALALIWVVAPNAELAGALLAVSFGFAVPVVVAGLAVHRRWRHARSKPHLVTDLRHAVRRDGRFAVAQVGAYLNATLEVWIAGVLLSGADTSMYGAGHRLAQLLIIPMTSLQVVFSPAIARLAVGDDRTRMERLLRTGSTLAVVVTAVIWLPMLIAPKRVLELVYGPGFAGAVPVLLFLTAGFFINALTGLSGVTLSMSHHEGTVAAVHWMGVIARLILCPLGALTFGITGLVGAATAVSVLVYAVMWVGARRKVGVSTHATLRPDLKLMSQTPG